MQNITIQVASPAVSAQTPTLADNSAVQTELFGYLLARQLAEITQFEELNAPNTGLPIVSAADEQPVEIQALTPDVVSALPNDMLATLLPHNIAAQISSGRTQPTQPEVVSHNRAPSIAMGKMPLKYDTPTTTLEIFNHAHINKNMTLLAEAQFTPETSIQLNAPQPNTTAMFALPVQAPNVSNLNSPIPLTVDMPVTNNAWGEEFSQKIVWMTTQQGQSAELHLNPPQLGPLDVLIKVNGDQATALFTSPHALVREAIEQALPKLREMLADNGIVLGNTTVSDQSPKEQQTKQNDQQHKGEGWQAKMDQAILSGGTQVRSVSHHQGIVDTFA
ncbi:MAG: flagellar hook-length control protein FliK [Candidatus Nitrotoga sp.]